METNQRKIMSSFNGRIMEIPTISADNFTRQSLAYFLSHCHTDHTEGLYTRGFLDYLKNKKNVYIYMSELSAIIVSNESEEFGVPDLKNYLKPLSIGPASTITIPADEGTEEQYISVSLIPAGHCLGSTMFLFKTLYKTVLYTGDFRISENSVPKYAQFHDENEKRIDIDAMYVDTTFQEDNHGYFPKRTENVELVINHISRWLNSDDNNRVALHTSANIGYEFVFNDIYKRLGQKVYVYDRKWRMYSQLTKEVEGVTDDMQSSKIHLCKNNKADKAHTFCFSPPFEHTNNYLYIHFSAYKWKEVDIEDVTVLKQNLGNRVDVCFATHCSKNELEYFVNYLSPKRIVGFREDYKLTQQNFFTPSKRIAPFNSKMSPNVCNKVAKVDKATVRKIFFD